MPNPKPPRDKSAPATIQSVNARHPENPRLAKQHAQRELRAVEQTVFERYQEPLQGSVLELSPGGSRLTDELIARAASYTGIGPSGAVIAVARHLHRTGRFVHADLRDLDQFSEHEFTSVMAGRCAIDLFGDDGRRELLRGIHRVLAPGGLFIFSSHNLDTASAAEPEAEPDRGRSGLAGRLFRRNRRDLEQLQEQGLDYAVRAGSELDASPLQYHISRDGQERQLTELGFRLIECLDLDARPVPPGEAVSTVRELHYVAQPARLAV
jgi:SAM-dependent methyltransferase